MNPPYQYFPTKCHFPDTLLMESLMRQDQLNVMHTKQGLRAGLGRATLASELGSLVNESSTYQAATPCGQAGGNFLPQWF
jgi:hypothetical protein